MESARRHAVQYDATDIDAGMTGAIDVDSAPTLEQVAPLPLWDAFLSDALQGPSNDEAGQRAAERLDAYLATVELDPLERLSLEAVRRKVAPERPADPIPDEPSTPHAPPAPLKS